MRFDLPKIYPITDRRLTGLSHTEQVRRLVAGGARFIQLREKHLPARDFFADAQAAVELARPHSAKIIINDRVDIALALKADGVHLGQDDLPPERARQILGEEAVIGFSTHNIEQAREAVRLPIDYLAIGPVFATTTKENPDDVVGIEGVGRVRRAVGSFPLVAIGGIDREKFDLVLAAGADSAAIIKALLSPPEMIETNLQSFFRPEAAR